jgi:hypothetical protein
VASRNGAWQGMIMPVPDPLPPTREPTGAGGPFVLILVAGIVIGFLAGQATIGFLIGAALGIAVAGWLWWRERG